MLSARQFAQAVVLLEQALPVKENQERSEALRQTQLEMLTSQNYQHPYYWAAFIPVGDWTAMDF